MIVAKRQDSSRLMIVMSNTLNRSICSIPLVQYRLVYFSIAIAQRSGNGFSDKFPVRFTTTEFCSAFPKTNINGSYSQLKLSIQNLIKLQTIVKFKNSEGAYQHKRINWFSLTEYKAGGKISIVFNEQIWQLISGLKSEFTRYPLYWISNLSSTYTCRMVGLLSQFKSTGVLSISLIDLRAILGVPADAYKARNDHLRARVFNPIVSELRKNNWKLTWEQNEDRVKVIFSVPVPSTNSSTKLSTGEANKT